jgi:hypothetical protein
MTTRPTAGMKLAGVTCSRPSCSPANVVYSTARPKSEGQHRPRPPERERQADVRAEGEELRGDDQHGDRQGRIETGLYRMPQRCQCELRVQQAAREPGTPNSAKSSRLK